jgi:hypothetical protein
VASLAHAALSDRLKDVDDLLGAHAAVTAAHTANPGRRYNVMGVNRGAVLLLSAHLEGYIEDLMEECLSHVNSSLSGKALRRGFMNPTADRIDDFFALIGLKNPTKNTSISWQNCDNARVRQSLKQLIETRNKIAHGTQETVHKGTVELLQRHLKGFASRFDEVVATHMTTILGTRPWP